MAITHKLISATTVSSTTNTVTISSIPGTYTNLLLKMSVRQSGGGNSGQPGIRFNGSTSDYSRLAIYGNGTGSPGVDGGDGSGESYARIAFNQASTFTANTFSSYELYIPNYAGATYKSFTTDAATEDMSTGLYGVGFWAGLWSNTAAITSISFSDLSGTGSDVAAGSTFYLYGIKNS